MPKRSAGLLLFKHVAGELRVLLVHPGGPFWAKRDVGSWSIPKGEYSHGEDARAAALREFQEETGSEPPDGALIPLGEVRQSGGKIVSAWAVAGDFDPTTIVSNSFELVWPPRSGVRQMFPEIDRADWFSLSEARQKLIPGQRVLLDSLESQMGNMASSAGSAGNIR